jgi:hypothetical protein
VKQYTVHYGSTVPCPYKTFGSWREAVAFMKAQLDTGVIVRSVSKEQVSKETIGVEE